MKHSEFYSSFQELFETSPVEALADDARYVFMSDLHLGDGGREDDLRHNRDLVQAVLAKWYLDRGYVLVLNGDVEDLSKFRYREIRAAWPGLYSILDKFAERGKLRKIVGNHDLGLLKRADYPYELSHGLVLEAAGRKVFAFHGHQASRVFAEYQYLSDFIVRYLAKPLRVKNSSISGDSRYRFKAERRIYKASKRAGILTISGHTHRPLFESLTKYDSLRWSIEDALREYAGSDPEGRRRLAELVGLYRVELERLDGSGGSRAASRSLYEEKSLLIPCLFNSGCATGKNGITALEIEGGSIGLAHWADESRARPYIEREALSKDALPGSRFARYILRSDELERVFARIELLGGSL
jgi:UDP-2,3-diacylglucosamine pyrophosphatase LpxH